jgi:MoaA/NifB/PqqE/SkfB family radical SAM enzyme
VNYINSVNNSIKNNYSNILRIIKANISLPYLFFFLRTILWQNKAMKLRSKWKKKDINVPPIMIASVTKRCNLKCKGCYFNASVRLDNQSSSSEVKNEKWLEIFREASELGISFIMIAGGEPLIKKELLKVIKKFPEIIFLLFTNGQLINEEIIRDFKEQKNLFPAISLEGTKLETDSRRGEGVYDRVQEVMCRFGSKRIPFGVSMTISKNNFNVLTDDAFIKDLIDKGCKFFFFLEYVPIEENTEHLAINKYEREKLLDSMAEFESKYPAIFITFPGNEDKFGGCLSAGRGFIHISPEGDLEPCPVAPYSDTNLKDMVLKDALRSDLLRIIRENHDRLSETRNGCALWKNRDWVESLVKSKVPD